MYQVIYYESEEKKNSPEPAIIDSETQDGEFFAEYLEKQMKAIGSTYCECYRDKYGTETYDAFEFDFKI